METCIVKQPILNKQSKIFGYEILYNNSTKNDQVKIDTAACTIENFLLQLNNDNFTNGKLVFLNFTTNLIMKDVPRIFAPNKLVIQINDATIANPFALKIVQRYRALGYKIAVSSFDFSARNFALLDNIDILKLDFSDAKEESLKNIINVGKSFNKKIIAFNVNNPQLYELAQSFGVEYMQGTCVAEIMSTKVFTSGLMQSNFFQLMVAITREEPEIDEIEEIISRDVVLTFSLIKLVNSAYFALRNQVKSVRQALVILGLGQLKHWIYLLSLKSESVGDLETEMIKTSFLRASFCQELYGYIKNPTISKSEAYLLGMFSVIDVLMQTPIEKIIGELGLSNEIVVALTKHEGVCGILYDLIIAYEQANWVDLSHYASELEISVNVITQKYFECVENVNTIWNNIMSPSTESKLDEMADNQSIVNPVIKNDYIGID